MSKPQTEFYRLWCGGKCHSPWLPNEDQVWRIAIAKGLAFESRDGMTSLGPLTWIEVGKRKYARSKTVPTSRKGG